MSATLTMPIVQALVSDILLVEETHLERAVNAFLTLQKTMAEGAGAAGLAALLANPKRFAGRKVGLILCGGNIDPRILASIMVRELERENRIVSFRLTIPDRPGVLGVIATRLGELGANILEVDHRRLFLDVPAKGAKLDVTVETRDAAHARGYRRGRSPRTAICRRASMPAARWSEGYCMREAVVADWNACPDALRRGAVRTRTRQRRIVARADGGGLGRLAPRQRSGSAMAGTALSATSSTGGSLSGAVARAAALSRSDRVWARAQAAHVRQRSGPRSRRWPTQPSRAVC